MKLDFSDRNPELGRLYAGHIETLSARHDDALDKVNAAHAVIFSGVPHRMFLDDNDYPFKANPHFVSWAPLTSLPLSYIVYTPGESPMLIYYQPRDYWHAVPGEPDGYWTGFFDVRVVHDPGDIAPLFPEARDKCIFLGEQTNDAHTHGIERVNPSKAINILHYARGRKTPYELECMRLSSRRAALGHKAAAEAFESGSSEFEIHQAYCQAVSHTDSELPYSNIIALNEHGAVLHYTRLDRRAPGEIRSFLIDAGAQVHGYASDVTRTYSRDDGAFRALIKRVETLQQDLVSRVRAGVDYRELHLDTHRLTADLLVDAGLARGDTDALVSSGVTSAFFPHGIGHLLGVQVHDVGGFMRDESGVRIDPPSGHPYLRLTRELEEDMVLTIEPGVYFIDMLLDNLRGTPAEDYVEWPAVDELRPYGGVRIEDDVRVTQGGSENLTRDAFADVA